MHHRKESGWASVRYFNCLLCRFWFMLAQEAVFPIGVTLALHWPHFATLGCCTFRFVTSMAVYLSEMGKNLRRQSHTKLAPMSSSAIHVAAEAERGSLLEARRFQPWALCPPSGPVAEKSRRP